MDFFDDLTAAIARNGTRHSVRCSDKVWQQFLSASAPAPARTPAAAAAHNEQAPPDRNIAPAAMEPPATAAVFTGNPAGDVPVPSPAPAVPAALPADWTALRQMVLNCQSCPLAAHRTNAVFGEGAENARLMFIGEGPGADEDATGRPFVGAAGQLLDKMISAMHLNRSEVYIANVVKCRPPGNRMPGEEEAACCIGYLHRQIELIKPEVIVLLGGTALHFLLKIDGITRHRGRWLDFNNIAVMATFHPAYLLRNPSAKREAWHDLKLVMAKLGISI